MAQGLDAGEGLGRRRKGRRKRRGGEGGKGEEGRGEGGGEKVPGVEGRSAEPGNPEAALLPLPGKGASVAYKARAQAGEVHCPTVAMDQHTLDVEDTADAGCPAGTAHPSDAAILRDAGLPVDAALLADTVCLTNAALPTDAACPAVNVRGREAAWPPALHFCSRHPRLYGLAALVLLLLVACVPIFTRTQPRPALTITTSPDLGTRENTADQVTPVSHIGCPNTTQQVRLISSLRDPFLPSGSIAAPTQRTALLSQPRPASLRPTPPQSCYSA